MPSSLRLAALAGAHLLCPALGSAQTLVSGGVRVTLPAAYNGELDATTGNGELRSDFDFTIEGRVNPRPIRATIGGGGPRLRLTTENGRLEVRKGS